MGKAKRINTSSAREVMLEHWAIKESDSNANKPKETFVIKYKDLGGGGAMKMKISKQTLALAGLENTLNLIKDCFQHGAS